MPSWGSEACPNVKYIKFLQLLLFHWFTLPHRSPLTMRGLISLLGLGIYVTSASAADRDHKSACTQLAQSLKLQNTTILSVSYVEANSIVSTAGSCQSNATVSSGLCRVYAQVNTSSTSRTKFEMWLPDEYYGRFITVGNGGINGCTSLLQVSISFSLT
jgi:hypothetical protein